MDWVLEKISLPHTWKMFFDSETLAERHLESIICEACLQVMADEHCRAIATGCGCEYILYHVEDFKDDTEGNE